MQALAKYFKGKIQSEVTQVHDQFRKDTVEFKKIIKENFKEKILAKAKALYDENLVIIVSFRKRKNNNRNFSRKSIIIWPYNNTIMENGLLKKLLHLLLRLLQLQSLKGNLNQHPPSRSVKLITYSKSWKVLKKKKNKSQRKSQ